ncbi:glycosyltransferase family 8 protein [Mycena galopus ATCC 62051]|nr:glycosyltransferase family 8 protein [Mycena galopus ATCC 62051]
MPSLLGFFTNRWTYERLPSHSSQTSSRTQGIVLWVLSGKLLQRPYSFLENYQNINPLPVMIEAGRDHIPPSRRAVVSTLESDGYAIGVAVAGYSAKSANVSARLLLPYLEDRVSERALCIVRAVGWEPYAVPLIPPPHGGEGVYPRFLEQFTKLNIWNLDQKGVDSAVYLDGDMLVRGNFDELFNLPFNFASVPDVYWDSRSFTINFNAGMIAFRPSSAVFEDMRQKIGTAEYPMKEAEQAFLNLYFGGTCLRLPYIYNSNLAMKEKSPVLWERLAGEMRVVHYTLAKPFLPHPEFSKVILTSQQMDDAIDRAARSKGGIYKQEVGWWEMAYRGMIDAHGDAIRECSAIMSLQFHE